MVSIRRVLLSAVVWVTAAAVGVAGFPRFRCGCVQGPSDPIPLDLAAAESGCCCGGGCCMHHKEAAANGDCCQQPKVPTSKPGEAELRAGPAGCTGTLTQPDTLAPSPARTTIDADATANPLLAPQAAIAPLRLMTPSVQLFGEADRPPPPIDRVIVLQHFLI
ncbi:MAG TPA: hypothetical protein VNK04_19805 [Gemmataceae bacterium]|nr:hypothetical protein [Gemmataceae bacterium]